MPDSRHTTGHSGTFTADFRHEFEAETRALLRERFLWFNGLLGAIWALMMAWGVVRIILHVTRSTGPVGVKAQDAAVQLTKMPWQNWASPVFELAALTAYAASFWAVRRGRLSDPDLLRMTYWLVFIDGTLRVVMDALGIPGGFQGLWGVAVAHALACTFLPWTPRQAFGPILPLLALNAAVQLVWSDDSWTGRLVWICFSPLVGLPGTAIAWFKHSRRMENYRTRFFQQRYGELRRELVDARRIHEALFPAPRSVGPVRFSYQYEPMRQIGGDYLFAYFSPVEAGGGERDGRLSIVVMDVTGHGIPAALTVNRLHGELERVFAEQPQVRPGEVLKLLNRYVHLTLATHSVYVTALCLRADCGTGELEYASGGHPPAFLRGVDGTIHELNSTAFVLGACADADFHSEPAIHRFGPGDAVIAYTDGAIEARDRTGRMLGVQGFARMVASLPNSPQTPWSEMLLAAVEQHRYGPPADDTLVIELARPV